MPLRGQQNLTNLGGKPKEPKPITCKVEQTTPQKPIGKQKIKGQGNKMGRARIWVSSTRERTRHEKKTFEEQHKVQKLTNTQKNLANGFFWCVPIEKKMTNKIPKEE
jgi:hypothetical protein